MLLGSNNMAALGLMDQSMRLGSEVPRKQPKYGADPEFDSDDNEAAAYEKGVEERKDPRMAAKNVSKATMLRRPNQQFQPGAEARTGKSMKSMKPQ